MAARRGLAKQTSRVSKACERCHRKKLSAIVRNHVLVVLGLSQNARIKINVANPLRLFSIILAV